MQSEGSRFVVKEEAYCDYVSFLTRYINREERRDNEKNDSRKDRIAKGKIAKS